MNAVTEEQPVAEAEDVSEVTEATPDEAQRAQFDELADHGGNAEEVELDVILDVPVTLSLEVGRTQISIRDLLRLNQGSVVELDRPADQPMDVRANGTLIARAEIVVVDDMFGIRLIDVVSPSERIRKIN
ncbi:MAG: flagellar motor switch protein FliN [Gammaproteobacteria bacterium]